MSAHNSSIHARGMKPTVEITTFPPTDMSPNRFHLVRITYARPMRTDDGVLETEQNIYAAYLFSDEQVDDLAQAFAGEYRIWKETSGDSVHDD